MEAGGERMEAGAPLHTRSAAPLGWAGSAPAPPTALLPAWPGERAVGRAWAAVPPIGPIGPAISGRAWTCPWARIEAQARPDYRARAGPWPMMGVRSCTCGRFACTPMGTPAGGLTQHLSSPPPLFPQFFLQLLDVQRLCSI